MPTRTVSRKVRRAGPAEFKFSEAEVQAASEQLREPEWLADRRRRAWQAWSEIPLPVTTDEPWRRTDLRGLPADQFERKPAEELELPPGIRPPEDAAATLVLRPGHEAELKQSQELREQGVVLADWATAVDRHADLLKAHLGQTVKDDEGKFAALAAALAVDGALIYVPKGVMLEAPLHALLWAPGDGLALLSRMLIVLEQGAAATVILEAASPDGSSAALHAGIVEVTVGDGARLNFGEIQNLGDQVWNFTHERVRVARDGYADWVFGSNGSRLTKNFSELSLEGEGAEARWSGFFFASDSQHLDHDTQQNHLAANTTSDLLFKGALTDRSRSVWQGMIYVAPGAQRTDGYQANRNLILSKKARADSIPGLEILADDVRCTHGATVSQLEQEPIFYLMSRGIPRPQAERLVVEGFFDSVMRRIENGWIRDRFQEMIDIKLRSRV